MGHDQQGRPLMQTTRSVKGNEASRVVFRVPDFVDADGISYSDIEIIVESEHGSDVATSIQSVGSSS